MKTSRSSFLCRHVISAAAWVVIAGCTNDVVSPLRTTAHSATARASSDMSLGAAPRAGTISEISLAWNDTERNESGWEVHRSTSGASGTFSLRVTLPVNSTGHVDASLTPATQYCYRVRWFRQKGPGTAYGPFSAVACATTYAAPPAPTGVSAVPDNGRIQVTWVDNATDETANSVERAASPTGPWTALANLPPNSTSFSDAGRPAEVLACYRVLALGAQVPGTSAPDCTVPPATPSNATASTTGTSSIDVSWTDASSAEDGYELQRALEGSSFELLAQLPPNSTSYRDANIVLDQRYLYRVRATRDGGFSGYSDYAFGLTVTGPPATPAVTATASGSTIWVQWGVSRTTTSIRIERSADGASGWQVVATVAASEMSGYADSDRAVETQMCYRVVAINGFGESPASSSDCTTPLAQPTNFVLTENSDFTYTATWTDNSTHEEGYLVSVYFCYPGFTYCEFWYDMWLPPDAQSATPGYPELYPLDVRACSADACSDFATSGPSPSASSQASVRTRSADSAGERRGESLRDRITRARRRP